ncbi:FecR family protein [Brevundimonas sp.]|uniref:FecR family protein n=1 Tax=Brevundimonas sp. TaxID=1871086 RepID=UPI003BAC17AA
MTDGSENDNDAFEQAGEWRLLRDRGLSPVEAERFRLWRREPGNAEAYDRVARSWVAFDGAAGSGSLNPALASIRARALKRGRRPSRRAFIGQVAAGVAVVAIGAGSYGLIAPGLSQTTYAANPSDVLDVVLDDGSHLTLDAGAVVKVRMKADIRDLTLVQGRARFVVAPDAGRPMQVDVGDGLVTVLGTTFNITRGSNGAVVTLIEGSISATAKSGGSGQKARAIVRLKPGEQVAIGAAGLGSPQTVDTLQATVWRDRKLDFADVGLAQALARVNRYADVPIVLADASLGALRISGSFDHGDSGGFAEGVSKLYGLEPVQANGRIVMRRARRSD